MEHDFTVELVFQRVPDAREKVRSGPMQVQLRVILRDVDLAYRADEFVTGGVIECVLICNRGSVIEWRLGDSCRRSYLGVSGGVFEGLRNLLAAGKDDFQNRCCRNGR